ncbi:MAG: hypothetical protein K5661_00785, partial [Bacteroidales bacterium]|nr:hypothetical protein [Bacteroidales bacterium]
WVKTPIPGPTSKTGEHGSPEPPAASRPFPSFSERHGHGRASDDAIASLQPFVGKGVISAFTMARATFWSVRKCCPRAFFARTSIEIMLPDTKIANNSFLIIKAVYPEIIAIFVVCKREDTKTI